MTSYIYRLDRCVNFPLYLCLNEHGRASDRVAVVGLDLSSLCSALPVQPLWIPQCCFSQRVMDTVHGLLLQLTRA